MTWRSARTTSLFNSMNSQTMFATGALCFGSFGSKQGGLA